jgi:Ca2+-binding RTX toxin-like protein
MATTFEVIFLGKLALIDTTQGNEIVENAAGILGTYGASGSPLSGQVRTLSADRLTEDENTTYDVDNGGGYDSFKINGGTSQNFDAVAIYNATITYVDGTTATITAVVFQDVNGNTYLAPEETNNADQTALTAKPIQSLTLVSVASNTGDMLADRVAGDFISSVDGTTGNDTMNVGYTDAQGDQISEGNDFIMAGSGNDSVSSGGGNDTIHGGAGNDTLTAGNGADWLDGEDGDDTVGSWGSDGGNDTMFGGAGNDLVYGGLGEDVVYGGTGNDTVSGGQGSDTIFGGEGNDVAIVTEDHGTDIYDMGEHAGDWDAVWFSNYLGTTGVSVNFTGNDSGTYSYSGGATGSFTGVEQIGGTAYADTINASADTDGEHIFTGDGADSVTGGAGNDTIYGGNGNDTVASGTGDDLLYGDDGADLLRGEAGTDTVFGGLGNDVLYGGDGVDSLAGGDGNDTLYGEGGVDSLSGGLGNDLMYGGDFSDSFLIGANEGSDTVFGGETGYDFDTIVFSGGPNGVSVTYTGSEAGTYSHNGGTGSFSEIEGLQTTAQADTINGSASGSRMTVWAGAGNDSLTGGGGDDFIDAGDGNDTVFGGSGADTINAGSGDDSITGGDGNDSIFGDLGNDALFGGAGDDTLDGADGNDTLTGGAGADQLFGGSGSDTADYSGSATGVTVNLLTGQGSGGDAQGDTLSGIENVIGSAHADALSTQNIAGDLFGGAGDDTLTGGSAANDQLYGGDGNDLISGGAGADRLFGGSGADTIIASGNDTVEGGDGWDVLRVGAGGIVAYGGGQNDSGTVTWADGTRVVFSGIEQIDVEGIVDGTRFGDNIGPAYTDAQGDQIDGTDGDADNIDAGAGNDTVSAGAGNDTVRGGTGDDRLTGGTGNDLLFGGDGSDTAVFSGPVQDYSFDFGPAGELIVIDGASGRDGADTLFGVEFASFDGVTYRIIQGDDGSNTTLQGPDDGTPSIIIAHDGNDWGGGHATSDAVFGGAGDDTLEGGGGDDTLVGGDDRDLLLGDDGNDALYGGAGDDTLQGGAGNDSLFGGGGADRLTGGSGADTVSTGDGADLVILTASGGGDVITDFDMALLDSRTTDQLDVSGLSNAQGGALTWRDVTVSDSGGDAMLTFPNGETVILQGVSPEQVTSKQQMASIGVPCFVTGTPILTPSGWRAVEALQPEDVVLTRDGPQRVIWAGRRTVSPDDLQRNPSLKPIHFRTGAIGNTRPLRLSPQHAVLMEDAGGRNVLVRARHLAEAGFGGARVAHGVSRVCYHHILLERHGILCAAGAATESFYPGPHAMSMLDWPARIALTAAIIAESGTKSLDHAETITGIYGPRAFPMVRPHPEACISAAAFRCLAPSN